MSKTDLENVSVGDTLVVATHYGRKQLYRVTRTTRTQVLAGEARYRKSDGCTVGGNGYNFSRARVATPEEIEEVKKTNRHTYLVRVIEYTVFTKLPLETLEMISSILEAGNE